MKIDKTKMENTHGYLEGTAGAVDETSAKKAILYKKEITKNYINLNSEQIDSRLNGSEFYVTRKYDGEMNVLFFEGDEAAIINRSGKIRTGLQCTEDAKKALKAAGITQAIIPGELYVDQTEGRTRVFDVLAALADQTRTDSLRLAFFDILELNGAQFKANSYSETHEKIHELFGSAKLCKAVECKQCKSKAEVKDVYSKWVEGENAEGLVVRTELPLVYKIKPRFTIDTVIVGYSEGTGEAKGQVRSLLLAMMSGEGEYQIIGKTGNGFSAEAKAELLGRLEPLVMDSKYIETDSNHVAFHMIKPEIVIELLINDVLFESTSGFIENPVLIIENESYFNKGNIPGISVVYPIFSRYRDDKKAVYEDIRLEQINEFSYLAVQDKTAQSGLMPSHQIKREVYKKESGSKLMVRKFVVWKTNKQSPDYPGYVFNYTDFSSERKDPLLREIAISDDEAQIMEIYNQSIEENIKKGWNAVS
ncbi:MAG: hypothetical protein LBU83_11200 [Bacteroidales bacterium]|jgi:hypothetical protein|nr:hypothetical protein [Bacteroidales bacterium]